MKAYRLDLRLKIVGALDRGLLPSQVAAAFGVGVSTVKRYRQQRRQTGHLAPRPIPGDTPRIGPAQHPALRAQVTRQPDATLAEHCRTWEREHGVRVRIATMSRLLARLRLPLKKRRSSPPSGMRPRARPGERTPPRSTRPPSSSSTRAAPTSA
jgi:transposase